MNLFVESVAYQEALPQMLEHQGVKATAIKPKGDKRTRLLLLRLQLNQQRLNFQDKDVKTHRTTCWIWC
jgi:hypothetical protein